VGVSVICVCALVIGVCFGKVFECFVNIYGCFGKISGCFGNMRACFGNMCCCLVMCGVVSVMFVFFLIRVCVSIICDGFVNMCVIW